MSQPLRLAIYLPSLSGGGAEKLHINLAPFFLQRGIDVTFVLDRADGALLEAVPQGAGVVSLNSKRVLQSVLPLMRYIKREKPDILLSNLGHNNIIAIWANVLARSKTKLIVTQHNMLSAESKQSRKYKYLPQFYRMFFPFVHGIVGVSAGISADMATHIGTKNTITTIYNGVVTPDFEQKAHEPVSHVFFESGLPVFLSVGRMVEQKDFPLLLHAFSDVLKQRNARLIILGEGMLRPQLEALAESLHLQGKVDMPGYVSNPLPYMKQASALVLSSRFEGFAIVLAEALACGTQVVSTDCPYGPAEILQHGKYGILTEVGNKNALATAMLQSLDLPIACELLRSRGNDFSVSTCAKEYIDLFERVMDSKSTA